MPGNDPLQAKTDDTTPAAQFENDRLDRDGIEPTQYPAQVDRAALDLCRGIAVGQTDDHRDIGGTISSWNFKEATGEFYVDGLQAIAGEDSGLAGTLADYDPATIGDLAYQLNALRHTLGTDDGAMDIDRALEAITEKTAAAAIEESVKTGGEAGAGLRSLRGTDSVGELTARLFSDPRVDAYAQALIDRLPGSRASRADLVEQLDAPRMTTPLWTHQREALARWQDNGQFGYVDMATATGKTVLGLAALSLRYDTLHPTDRAALDVPTEGADSTPDVPSDPRVLIVAGTDLILDQWRTQFDEHLDIPTTRTRPTGDDERTIELSWGTVEFRTAQGLLDVTWFDDYDLVVLDEAHRYTRSKRGGRGWGDLFESLTDGANAVLAMSGSIDDGWVGDPDAKDALDDVLPRCYRYDVAQARQDGVIADFSWTVRYLPATGDRVDRVASQTRITTAGYDAATGRLDADALGVDADTLPADVVDYDDLRSLVQSNDGGDLRSRSSAFDAFASALLARKPLRWNTTPDDDAIADLVAEHAPAEKTVVLVRSYKGARRLGDRLVSRHGMAEADLFVFDDSDADRLGTVERFNAADHGVIIGPGDLLGTGVDMPDAEVAVNVSRGGVNASLVQRIGRILRNPSGEKTAEFHHLIAQPTEPDAIDFVDDGAKLLERAASFRALGKTFREAPLFRAHPETDTVLADLEDGGVELLERVEDERLLVDTEAAHEHLRSLQAHIYDTQVAHDADEPRTTPALTDWTSAGAAADADDERLYPERNDAYEQYRLTLSPYRACKAVATNLYDAEVDVEEADDGYRVAVDDERLSDTELHAELRYWLNAYRNWRERCDNRDGSGEPGSLPQYRSEWPEPPDGEAVMLPREVVAEIGVSYAEADPIFLPVEDGEPYALPLPDGRYLTVDGIVDEPQPEDDRSAADPATTDETADDGGSAATGAEAATETDATAGQPAVTVNSLLLTAAEARDEPLADVVTDAVAALLKTAVDDDVQLADRADDQPREVLDVELSDHHERLLGALVDETPGATVGHAVDVALQRALAGNATTAVELDGAVAAALSARFDDDDAASAFVGDAVAAALRGGDGQ